MRNLPPLPTDVLTFEAEGYLDTSSWKIVHHLFCSGSIAYGPSEFSQVIYGWATFAMSNLLDVMPDSAGFTTCRLRRVGTSPFVVAQDIAFNQGAGSTAQSLNTALCFTWRAQFPGEVGRSHTRLPLQSSVVDANKRVIDPAFIGFAALRAALYLANVNSIVVAGFASPELVVVRRATADAPLPVAGFSPVVGADVSRRVATLRRRLLLSH